MIYTSKGNLPVSELEERVLWTDSTDETVCTIEHWHNGECVRRQPNVYVRKGVETSALGGAF